MSAPSPDIHFDESLVRPALDALSEERSEVDAAWLAATSAIKNGESHFGPPDTLNQAFRPGYAPRAQRLRPDADRRQGQYGELVAAGHDSVEIYRRGDGNSAIPFLELN
ncbi:hypothetical protein LZ318_12930 [Saccharopolyspora indica]|uniref:hypothetical protein n=1 Tax=Saccharopolyspora indica TaxID=1229659 RepID=UPI0022EB87F9|nr:hypothetical protein [Saccharopolyspora indica]MDA3647201.1 hypothetical protein [Saccharopolyspora indica]